MTSGNPMDGADTAPPAPPAELADLAQAIDVLAAGVARRLTDLRHELEPTRVLWTRGRVDLDPAVEWTLAADGILGPDGILGLISEAIRADWPGYPGAGWSDPEPGVGAART
ncbi:hypothetical protein O7623_19035 [Solwaraspora sp. WMMD791]|uniref:hypothetical protein n=1 Tax=Solwaraspora sp. WMMD791 TaxID=3016086 RepID=UPI00249CEE47|nr:hypothetical protein [Solwaraspora sp. WMMD791]WFE25480.1 hypothetical protein O7623_19035 [Solwaraspora sp. WMMD791]